MKYPDIFEEGPVRSMLRTHLQGIDPDDFELMSELLSEADFPNLEPEWRKPRQGSLDASPSRGDATDEDDE